MNIITPTPKGEHPYGLRLADGQAWQIMATPRAESWLENLASIMGLRAYQSNGSAKLIFHREEPENKRWGTPLENLDPKNELGLPSSTWKVDDLKAVKLWSHPCVPDVICEIGCENDHTLDIIRMWLALHPIYQRAQESGGLPLHAALVARNGMGVLLAAQGGVGKSTCSRRLPPRWRALSDDETLVVRDDQKRFFAHPFPTWSDHLWRGSTQTWNVQKHLPLSAIFFLEKADTDKVVSLSQSQAAVSINESATEVCRRGWRNMEQNRQRRAKEQLFSNACELAKRVPAFKLRFSPNGRFWEEMEKALSL